MIFILVYTLIAFLMNLVGFSRFIITGMNELFGLDITLAGYYTMFILFGVVCHIINLTRRKW